MLRKEKLKAEKKAMEELKHKDPSAYADELMRMHQDHIKVNFTRLLDTLQCSPQLVLRDGGIQTGGCPATQLLHANY